MTAMLSPRYLLGSIALVVGIAGRQDSAHGQLQDNPMMTVRVQDIPQKVKIIGVLGQPMGDLLTIRGQWFRDETDRKDPTRKLRVTRVNETDLIEPIVLHGLQVRSIFPNYKGKNLPPGERWDWIWRGDESPPPVVEGATWEMMGVESGVYDHLSPEAWKEVGGGTLSARPAFMHGFYTRFEFIAVKVVKER